MATQKLTLSIDPIIFQKFKFLATSKGFSISGWVTAQMRNELDKNLQLQNQYQDCTKLFAVLADSKEHLTFEEIKQLATKVYDEEIVNNICEEIERQSEIA